MANEKMKFFDNLVKTTDDRYRWQLASKLEVAIKDLELSDEQCQLIANQFKTGSNLAWKFFRSKKLFFKDFLAAWLEEQGHGA